MRAHDFIRQFGNRSRCDSPPVGEDAELARHAARERQLLFDQKHGQPELLVQIEDDAANFVDDIRLNPFGRLIENQ